MVHEKKMETNGSLIHISKLVHTENDCSLMLTEFKGKSNMITWSTSKSSPLAARSVQTNVGQSPSSLLNFLRFSTLFYSVTRM